MTCWAQILNMKYNEIQWIACVAYFKNLIVIAVSVGWLVCWLAVLLLLPLKIQSSWYYIIVVVATATIQDSTVDNKSISIYKWATGTDTKTFEKLYGLLPYIQTITMCLCLCIANCNCFDAFYIFCKTSLPAFISPDQLLVWC